MADPEDDFLVALISTFNEGGLMISRWIAVS